MTVDDELRRIAERSAARIPDARIQAAGWTRDELVDALHQRLRTKFMRMWRAGELKADSQGRIGHATPPKRDKPRWWRGRRSRGRRTRRGQGGAS